MQDELQVNVGPSKGIKAALIVQHLGGFLCVAYTCSFNTMAVALLGVGIFWHLYCCIKKYVHYHDKSSMVNFSLKPSGQGVFYLKSGLAVQGTILHASSYLSAGVIVLAVKSKAAKTHYAVIGRGSISSFSYQRLLAHMRAIPRIAVL